MASVERKHLNSLWHCDIREADDVKPRPLLMLFDDHSRSTIASKLLRPDTAEVVSELLIVTLSVFSVLAKCWLTTLQFYTTGGHPTVFGCTRELLGIKHITAGVRRQTTCGKIERWNRSLQEGFMDRLDGTRGSRRISHSVWSGTAATGLITPRSGISCRCTSSIS